MNLKSLSEITDVDARLFRTLLHLFVDPKQVIEDNTDRYSSAIRYATIIMGGGFLFIFLLEELTGNSQLHHNMWRAPLRTQLYAETYNYVTSDLVAFTVAIGFIPGVWIFNILLYWNKKSISEFFKLSLYLITQISLSIFIIIIIDEYTSIDAVDIVYPIIILYPLYFYLRLGYNKWYVTIPKSVIIISAGFITFLNLYPIINNLYVTVINRPSKDYNLQLDSKEILTRNVRLSEGLGGITKVSKVGERYFFTDYWNNFGEFMLSDSVHWRAYVVEYTNIHLLPIEQHQLLLVIGDTANNEQYKDHLRLYSFDGQVEYSFSLSTDLNNKNYQLLSTYKDGFDLLVPEEPIGNGSEYIFKVAKIRKQEGQWHNTIHQLHSTSEPYRDIIPLDSSNYLASIMVEGGWHWAEFGIAKLDSNWNSVWTQNVYDKTSPFDPPRPLKYIVNRENNEVITHYAISNDTTNCSVLSAFDLSNGNRLWEKEIYIPTDITVQFDLTYDNDYIYLVGESHQDVRQWFWRPIFHASYVARIDRETGQLMGYKHFGFQQFDGHSFINTVFATDSTLLLFGYESKPDRLLLDEEDINFFWEIRKEDI